MTLLSPPQTSFRQNRGPDQSRIPTYYEQPALKPSLWGWLVSGYISIGGIAGSAQILAAAADLAGDGRYRVIVRNGRYLALAGAAVGAPLLIADLHTPQRFYNMLRIFRPTSPMSIGTYVLLGFSGFSAVLAAAQLRRDMRMGSGVLLDAVARVVELPAAVFGAAMSTYTGALLGATSTPLWAASPLLIPALFGSSAIASAAAALSVAAPREGSAVLDRIELLASASELALMWGLHRQLAVKGIETKVAFAPPLLLAAAPWLRKVAPALTSPSPRRQDAAPQATTGRIVAAVAVLVGAFLLRHAILRAGNRSAQQPRAYFRLARR
jgi:formate-dependent nitrite reductase membrane component NrfD